MSRSKPSSSISPIPRTGADLYAEYPLRSFNEELELYKLLDIDGEGEPDADIDVDDTTGDILLG